MHFIEIVCHLRKTNVLLFFGVGLVGKARHFWKNRFLSEFFCNRIIIYAIDSPVVFWGTFYHLSEQIELVLMTQKYCTHGLARCAVTLCVFSQPALVTKVLLSVVNWSYQLPLNPALLLFVPIIRSRICLSNLVWAQMEKYQIQKYYFFTQILRERSCWRS